MTNPESEDFDALGVIYALERICELESRMRQAIQQTHPLTTTLDWDFQASDREREALLLISEQLEFLEDKLRAYRFMQNPSSETKAITLAQLDTARKELLEAVQRAAPRILFGKDIVREVLAFASVDDSETLNSSISTSAAHHTLRPENSEAYTISPNAPNSAARSLGLAATGTLLGLVASPKRPSNLGPGSSYMPPAARAASRGSTPAKSPPPAPPSMRRNALWEAHHAEEADYHNTEDADFDRAGPSSSSRPLTRRRPPAGLDHPPLRSSYARSDVTDTYQSEYGGHYRSSEAVSPLGVGASNNAGASSLATTPEGKGGVGGARRGLSFGKTSFAARLSSITKRTISSERMSPVQISDEDIYGPPVVSARGSSVAASAAATPRRDYGGMVRIRDMLDRAEKGLESVAEAQEQRRSVPARIVNPDEEDESNIASPSGTSTLPNGAFANAGAAPSHLDDDIISQWGGTTVGTFSERGGPGSIRDWQIRAEPPMNMTPPISTVGTPTHANRHHANGTNNGGGKVIGKLAGLAFVLGSLAAATMAAGAFSPAKKLQQQQRNRAGGRRGTPGKSSSSAGAGAGAAAKRGGKHEPADMPPWADGTMDSHPVKGSIHDSSASSSARSSPGRKERKGGNGSRSGRQQMGIPPVQNVQQQPSGRTTFPSNPPPDVSSVMG